MATLEESRGEENTPWSFLSHLVPEFPSAFLASLGTLSNTRGMGIPCSGSPEALPAHRKGLRLSLSPNAPPQLLHLSSAGLSPSACTPAWSFWQEYTAHIPAHPHWTFPPLQQAALLTPHMQPHPRPVSPPPVMSLPRLPPK